MPFLKFAHSVVCYYDHYPQGSWDDDIDVDSYNEKFT